MTTNRTVHRVIPSTPAVEFCVGLLIGVAAGVAAGLLTAPASGRDSRAWLLARSAAVRRNTAEFLHARNAMAIVRQRGVLGLVEVLRHGDPTARGSHS